ncbi:MAG TPA: electron transfer flavoprotein subunit alpha/FixB family protein [Thermoanaerobaculia bacterium]|nr:electron transfer flavoprotein subunit alpha/FixB family protein [Thermoanaerobaculia bacterium]
MNGAREVVAPATPDGVVLVALVERASAGELRQRGLGERLERGWRAPLAAGRCLAARLHRPLELLVVGPAGTREALAAERGSLDVVARARCLEIDADPVVARSLSAWIVRQARRARALHVLLAHDYGAIEQLPAIAEGLGAAMVSGAIGVELEPSGDLVWSRPSHQGKLVERLASTPDQAIVATVRPEGFAGDGESLGAPSPAPEPEDAGRLDVTSDAAEIEWLGDEEAEGSLDLAAAERIVAVGRGLGDPERLGPIRELAVALDAEVAGSRPVIDAGWLPHERQVGSSGVTVSPQLYLALGISGSAQHLAGMSTSRWIVAINRDPQAPIFRVAHFAVVGDLHAHASELVRALEEDPAPSS